MVGSLLRRIRGNSAIKLAARVGLVGRGVFYLLLTVLALKLLVQPPRSDRQANANGALTEVARNRAGLLLLAAAAIGFAAFGVVRLAGAASDERQTRLRRVSTAGQGVVYVGLCAVTASFVLGRRATGSEEQQRSTAGLLLALPGGRLLVATAGAVVVAVCCWQVAMAIKGGFADTLHTEQMGRRVQRLTRTTARVGIPARALAFLPVGVLLVAGGVRSDPRQTKGLDALLLELARTGWGKGVVVLVAAGFVIFAIYSFLEARYRQVSSGG